MNICAEGFLHGPISSVALLLACATGPRQQGCVFIRQELLLPDTGPGSRTRVSCGASQGDCLGTVARF